jgi:tRNA U34 2-thiouridine synthase MnmA/TrmU
MLRNCYGKLLIQASGLDSQRKRLQHVSKAARKVAKILDLDLEIVKFQERFSQIYVYFENGEDEPIPIYCDKSGKDTAEDICLALRNMMFVLSFHPKHSALKQMRKTIMRFS